MWTWKLPANIVNLFSIFLKALLAVAHSLIDRVWVVLKRRQPYVHLVEHYFDLHDEERIVRHSLRHLEACSYKVTLEKSA